MSEQARAGEGDDLTAEERAQIRALLRLLRRASVQSVDAPAEKPVRRDREPPPEAFDRVAKLRRRKGIRNG